MSDKACVRIYRGLPGSGKSHLAEKEAGLINPVCSADNFFVDTDGVYRFDPKLIGDAHLFSLREFARAVSPIETPYSTVIVDNTNIHAWEISPYVQLAAMHGWDAEIITVWCTPELAMKRNVHNVPNTTILKMYQDLLTETLPSWWKHTAIMAGGLE